MTSSPQSSIVSLLNVAAAAALFAALLPACTDEAGWHEQRRLAMGTSVNTIYRATDAQAHISAELDELLEHYGTDYYAWGDGELGQLNAALIAGYAFTASPTLLELLARAQALSARSEGYFDPGVGLLVEAWGFHSADSAPREPDATFLEQWQRTHASIADLRFDGLRLSTDARGLVLDLGGIAKGAIIDMMLERFSEAGITDVLVDAGGDVRVRGRRGARHWMIGIQSPRGTGVLGSVALHDGEAAFTSGDYERFYDGADGRRRHHLIDPHSGLPAAHTQAVTVIADNGALADAAATALFVAGPEQWRDIAAALGVSFVLRVDASGRVEMTPAMRERVRMQPPNEPATMTVEPELTIR